MQPGYAHQLPLAPTRGREIHLHIRAVFGDPQTKGVFRKREILDRPVGITFVRDNGPQLGVPLGLVLHGGHFDVGVLGAKYLIEGLTEYGRADVAHALAVQTGFPGWVLMLEGGRITLSEFWDLHGSHNHVMMGSIDGWFYRTLAGIRIDEAQPAFRHFSIKPFIPGSLSIVSARVQTIRGQVVVDWKKERRSLRMWVTLPANTTATIHMPSGLTRQVRTTPSLPRPRFEKGAALFEAGSGDFEFETAW
jgi:alpha-L-rhamnosidase